MKEEILNKWPEYIANLEGWLNKVDSLLYVTDEKVRATKEQATITAF